MAFYSTQAIIAAAAITEADWQRQSHGTAGPTVVRACVPASHAAVVSELWHVKHGIVERRKIVIGCQLCMRGGVPVNSTTYKHHSQSAETRNWVLCKSCEASSGKSLEDQLTDLRATTLSSIKLECRVPPCEECGCSESHPIPTLRTRTSAVVKWPEAHIMRWCRGCETTMMAPTQQWNSSPSTTQEHSMQNTTADQ